MPKPEALRHKYMSDARRIRTSQLALPSDFSYPERKLLLVAWGKERQRDGDHEN